MRRPRTTAAAFATLMLLICAWGLLALATPSLATSGPHVSEAQQFERLLRGTATAGSDTPSSELSPCAPVPR